jgi:hypothetical protein
MDGSIRLPTGLCQSGAVLANTLPCLLHTTTTPFKTPTRTERQAHLPVHGLTPPSPRREKDSNLGRVQNLW